VNAQIAQSDGALPLESLVVVPKKSEQWGDAALLHNAHLLLHF
jgi:hypothetical protein